MAKKKETSKVTAKKKKTGKVTAKKKEIGKVTHFYPNISVAVIQLTGALNKGDKISIEGHESIVEQTVGSMQVEHKPIEKAKKGDAIGLKVNKPVKEKDVVYLVKE